MSNKSRLQTNNTNLQALIDKANALPDAEGTGGGSIETCTVELSTSEGRFTNCVYTYLDNGQITSAGEVFSTNAATTSISFNNIICGSYITCNIGGNSISIEQCDGFERVLDNNNWIWRVTAGAGETAILKFYNPF